MTIRLKTTVQKYFNVAAKKPINSLGEYSQSVLSIRPLSVLSTQYTQYTHYPLFSLQPCIPFDGLVKR